MFFILCFSILLVGQGAGRISAFSRYVFHAWPLDAAFVKETFDGLTELKLVGLLDQGQNLEGAPAKLLREDHRAIVRSTK
jgi:hypothetical protein